MACISDSYVTADYTAAAELTGIDLYRAAPRPRTRCVVYYKFTALDGSASRIGVLATENQHTVTDLSQRPALPSIKPEKVVLRLLLPVVRLLAPRETDGKRY